MRRPPNSTNPNTPLDYQNKDTGQQRKVGLHARPRHRFLPTFSRGRFEGAEIRSTQLGASPQPECGRALTHPPGGRSRLGTIPESRRGRLRAEGAPVPEKPAAATGMPGPEPGPPRSPRAPLVPAPRPAPWARPGKPLPPRAPGGRRGSGSTCARDTALRRPSGMRLRQGVDHRA